MIPDQTSSHDPSFQIQRLNPDQISLLQPFNHLPDELLLAVFQCFDPIKRSLLLSICRKWNDTLLKNHSLWNSLVLEDHFSFEETVSILRLFNSRSGHQLQQVCLGREITRIEDLLEIIEELKKSAATLRVLGLVERHELSRETRKLVRISFSKLNTFDVIGCGRSSGFKFSDMFDLREEVGINDLDEEMRYLSCEKFLDSDEEETKWLSGLRYLELTNECSSKDLRTILNANRSSLKHLELSMMNLRFTSNSGTLNFGAGKVDMMELETLYVPWTEGEAVALGQMLGTTERIEMTEGKVHCLKYFNLSLVQSLGIIVYEEGDEDEQALLNSSTILVDHENLLRKCKSLNQLQIDCIGEQTNKVQLDVLFKLLIIPSKSNTTPLESSSGALDSHSEAKQQELGIEESDPVHQILLPDLVKLTILSPIQLDGKLLNQLVQSRKGSNPEFEIELLDEEGDEIVEAEWEARGWMI